MRVLIVCPTPTGSRLGTTVTAERWRMFLRQLGHRVTITSEPPRVPYDVLVALHARRSAEAVRWSHATHPTRPIIVALTGTDLYRDIQIDASARRSLRLAERLVVLHDKAPLALPRAMRSKARVIRQSCPRPEGTPRKAKRSFDVAFVAHLRPEKDPLRVALAARLLAPESRIKVIHAGTALTEESGLDAESEQRTNPRYQWIGGVSGARARQLIARSQVLVLTSVMEGGANVLGEAVVAGTPVIASRIPATSAALGADYPALFRVGDTHALARLLARVEDDPKFLAELRRRTRARQKLFAPSAEKAAWRALLAELSAP